MQQLRYCSRDSNGFNNQGAMLGLQLARLSGTAHGRSP